MRRFGSLLSIVRPCSIKPFRGAGLALAGALVLAGSLGAAQAAPLTVDGNLSDWGVTVADNNGSDFSTVVSGSGILGTAVEDQNDFAGDGGFVGPNYGGQNYDVEFMAVALQGNDLYVAISTGQRPDNGFSRFGPGDLRIENLTTGVRFGMEIGGGAGGGSGTAQTEGEAGSTYTLNGSGNTVAHSTNTGALAAQTTGTIWTGADWILDPISPQTPVQFTVNGSSQQVATADYVYTRDSVTTQHAIIEMSFDVRTLLDSSNSGILSLHWGPACGNDVLGDAANPLQVTIVIPETPPSIPAPAAITLLPFGMLALAGLRARAARHSRKN